MGSTLTALAVHVAAYGLIVGMLGIHLFSQDSVPPPGEMELNYEVLNEPPKETKVVRQVVHMKDPTPVQPTKAPMDTSPRELHEDSKDAVAGTQAARALPANIGGENNGDAASTPFYKIKPKYPKAALIAGTEGWVLLKVDVKENGEVENVRVIDGVQRNLFGDEARRAVEKWKYRPFLDKDGKAVRRVDHPVRVDFKLSDA